MMMMMMMSPTEDDFSHKLSARLSLHSARPAVTLQLSFDL